MIAVNKIAKSSVWQKVELNDGASTVYKHPSEDLYALEPVIDMSVDEFLARLNDHRDDYGVAQTHDDISEVSNYNA